MKNGDYNLAIAPPDFPGKNIGVNIVVSMY